MLCVVGCTAGGVPELLHWDVVMYVRMVQSRFSASRWARVQTFSLQLRFPVDEHTDNALDC